MLCDDDKNCFTKITHPLNFELQLQSSSKEFIVTPLLFEIDEKKLLS